MSWLSWVRIAINLFAVQSAVALQRLMQYRADFLFGLLVSFGFSAMGPLAQFLIYSKTRGYPEWSFDQILLLQAVLLLGSGLRELFVGGVVPLIDRLMSKGEFDRLLLKPYPPLLLILTGGFSPSALGTILVGGCAVGWAWIHSEAPMGLVPLALFLLLLATAVLLYLSAAVLYCTLVVRWVYPMRLGETMDKVLGFGEYPLTVYPAALRAVLLTVLPLSVAAYWPAQALLGRLNPQVLVAALSTVGVWMVVLRLWDRQLTRYTSAGG